MTNDFTSLKPLANHVSFNNKMWWRNDWTWIAVIRILFLERAKTFILVADWGKELWSSLIEDHRKLRNYKERWAYWNSSSYRSVCANTTAWNLVGAIIILLAILQSKKKWIDCNWQLICMHEAPMRLMMIMRIDDWCDCEYVHTHACKYQRVKLLANTHFGSYQEPMCE